MFPFSRQHANRSHFEGVMTLLDVPSDKAPSGSRGHRVILTTEAAREALPSLLGMAVAFKDGWAGHNARQKCGIITDAEIRDGGVWVAGFIYCKDFPEVSRAIDEYAGEMGFSYEMADAHVENMRAPIWRLTRTTFTGAAILLREKAAYRGTSIRNVPAPLALSASASGTRRVARVQRRVSKLWKAGQKCVKRLRF